MNAKFNGIMIFSLLQYLEKKEILNSSEFRDHCLGFVKHTTLTEAEEEAFRKLILRMPGISAVE